MDRTIEMAVERAIATMRDNLGGQVTVDDMARAAMFSKFHFTRIFQQATGVSPGRFLSAMRLQQAKRLLVSTSLSVADISALVGYNSVGTFSTRFTRSVGLSPISYRRLGGFSTHIQTRSDVAGATPSTAVVCGTVRPHRDDRPGTVFIGLFPGRIPQGNPVTCTIMPGPGLYHFTDVPLGTWYLLAQSVAHDAAGSLTDMTENTFAAGDALTFGTRGPVGVRHESVTVADLDLKPMRTLDPPVLLALLDARKFALQRREAHLAGLSA